MFLLRMQAAVEQWEKQLRKWLEHISNIAMRLRRLTLMKAARQASSSRAALPARFILLPGDLSGYASHVPHI